MPVRMSQYGKEMDKETKGKSLEALHKRAVHKSSLMTKKDKFDQPGLMDTMMLGVMKRMRRRAGGPGQGPKPKPKMEMKTERTKQIESGLKQAGLTEKEVGKMRRKK